MAKKNNKSNYIEDYIELQENQYNYDWQLKQTPWELEHKSRYPRIDAWLYIFSGLGVLLIPAFIVFIFIDGLEYMDNYDKYALIFLLLASIFWIFICVQFIRRGIRQLWVIKNTKMQKTMKRKRKRKK